MPKTASYSNKIYNCFFFSEFELIPTRRGKHLLMWQKYTYYQCHKRTMYNCSKYGSGCKASLKRGLDGKLEYAIGDHTHPPPVYVKTADGEYIKIQQFSR